MILRFLYAFYLLGNCFIAQAQPFKQWEPEIRAFEIQDSMHGYTEGGILFMGSSSIRLWNSISEDFKPHQIVQRGFGGSSLPDVIYYTDRIIARHQPCAVVLFVANDITGGANDKSPNQVAALYENLISIIRKQFTKTPIFILAITPTGSRWSAWPQIQAANTAIADMVSRKKQVQFVPTEHLFLNSDGLPDSSLFVADKLHLSSGGYAKWTTILKPLLDEAVGDCKE